MSHESSNVVNVAAVSSIGDNTAPADKGSDTNHWTLVDGDGNEQTVYVMPAPVPPQILGKSTAPYVLITGIFHLQYYFWWKLSVLQSNNYERYNVLLRVCLSLLSFPIRLPLTRRYHPISSPVFSVHSIWPFTPPPPQSHPEFLHPSFPPSHAYFSYGFFPVMGFVYISNFLIMQL